MPPACAFQWSALLGQSSAAADLTGGGAQVV